MGLARNLSKFKPNSDGLVEANDIDGALSASVGGTGLTTPGTSGNVLTSNGTAWASTAPAGGGKLLEVALASATAQQSIATTTYTDLTNLSITITPKSVSSKFLLTYNIHANLVSSGRGFAVRFVRNGTALYTPGDFVEIYNVTGDASRFATGNQFLDSPATTSSITYKLQAATSGSLTVQFSNSQIQNTFTVMEIAS